MGDYSSINRMEPGGSRWAVGSGGSLDVESGGEVDFEAGAALKIGGVAVTPSAAELNVLNAAPMAASFTIGNESSNTRNVAIQLKDADGADMAIRSSVLAYLSEDANGDSIVTNAPNGGVTIGTDGLAIPLVANKAWWLVSEPDGDIDLSVVDNTARNMYLIIALPNGKLAASAVIAFA
jgi:hypothetical protein